MSKSKVTKSPVKGAPQTPTMIHEHIDNFLAKIVGETPIDDNPRDSTEYWLNEIADRIDGIQEEIDDMPAQKELWWHGCELYISPTLSMQFHILNNSGTTFNKSSFTTWLNSFTNIDIAVNGGGKIGDVTLGNVFLLRKTGEFLNLYYYTPGSANYTTLTVTSEIYESFAFNDRPNRVM